MKKLVFLSIVIFSAFSFTLIAQPIGKFGPKSKNPRAILIQKLNLTPEQQKKIDEIKYDHQQNMIEMKSQIEKNRLEMRKMISENKIDDKKLLDLINTNSKIQADIKYSSTQNWLTIYKMLNDEQKEIWTKHLGGMNDRLEQGFKARIKCGMNNLMMQRQKMRMHR